MIYAVIISILLILLSILRPASKIVSFFVFILMFLLFGWNYWNGDYDAYENLYNNALAEFAIGGYERGYTSLMSFFSIIGFDFQQFFITVALFSLLLLFNFIVRYSKYPAIFSCIFFCFFFPLDYVILRNFIALTIVLQGLIFVINQYKYSLWIFGAFVFIASLFHSTAIFYMVLIPFLNRKNICLSTFLLCVIAATFFLIIFGNRVISLLVTNVNGRDELYASSFLRFIFNSGIQILNLLIILFYYKKGAVLSITEKEQVFNKVLTNINIVLLFLIPIYYSFAIAERLFRNISIINIVFMTNILYEYRLNRTKIFLFLLLILYLSYFYLSFIHPYLDDTVYSLYRYNLIFK